MNSIDRPHALLAYKNEQFLDSEDARPLRILADRTSLPIIKATSLYDGSGHTANLKCRAETKARFIRIADARQISLGALFEQMLSTYEKLPEGVSPPSTSQPSTKDNER